MVFRITLRWKWFWYLMVLLNRVKLNANLAFWITSCIGEYTDLRILKPYCMLKSRKNSFGLFPKWLFIVVSRFKLMDLYSSFNISPICVFLQLLLSVRGFVALWNYPCKLFEEDSFIHISDGWRFHSEETISTEYKLSPAQKCQLWRNVLIDFWQFRLSGLRDLR